MGLQKEICRLDDVVASLEERIFKMQALVDGLEVRGNFTTVYLVPKLGKCSDWIQEWKNVAF